MITTVTLNASIDKAYHMSDEIINGTVMRVASSRNSAGGKGLNVARVIQLCEEEVKATGLVGGYNGKYLESLLDMDGIKYDFCHIRGETRNCINILDPEYGSTEYLEAGGEVTEEEKNEFLALFRSLIRESEVITLSGSAPKGMGKDIYKHMVNIAKEYGKQVILDTSGELLKEGVTAGPTLVKPNKNEIEMLYNTKLESREDVIFYAKKIQEQGIPYVVISLGSDGALLVCEQGIYQGIPPKVEVINTVGCGDSMVGAFAVALIRDYQPEKALKYAVAVATANALTPNTGEFHPSVRDEIMEKINIVRL